MKKKIFIVLIFVEVIVVYGIFGAFGIVSLPKFITETFSQTNKEPTDIERISTIIQKEHPTELILLGEDITFETGIPVRKISCVTDDLLKRGTNYEHTFFIINDLKDDVQLTEEEIDLLAEKISQPNFCLVYLGTKYNSSWNEPNEHITNLDGNLSWRYYQLDGQLRRYIGGWTQDDQNVSKEYPYMLSNSLLYEIDAYLSEIN